MIVKRKPSLLEIKEILTIMGIWFGSHIAAIILMFIAYGVIFYLNILFGTSECPNPKELLFQEWSDMFRKIIQSSLVLTGIFAFAFLVCIQPYTVEFKIKKRSWHDTVWWLIIIVLAIMGLIGISLGFAAIYNFIFYKILC